MGIEKNYRRSVNHNYMILRPEFPCINDYRITMVMNCNIKNLLNMDVEYIDEVVEFIYDISNLKNIGGFYERKKMKYSDLLTLFKSIINVVEDGESYLLRIEDILFDMEYVYVDERNEKVLFCYCPQADIDGDFNNNFRRFVQEIVLSTDHTDGKAAELIYGILEICNREDFLMKDIRDYMNKMEGGYPKRTVRQINYETIRNESRENEKNKEHPIIAEENEDSYKSIFENDNIKMGKGKKKRIVEVVKEAFGIKEAENENKEHKDKVIASKNKRQEMKHPHETDERDDMTMLLSQKEYRDVLVDVRKKENIELDFFPCVIGKDGERVDKIIREQSVSRVHLKVYNQGDDYYVEDQNSTNGTFINDEMLDPFQKYVINNGDTLTIADHEYIFKHM